MNYGVTESEVSTEDRVLRRLQGPMGYGVRTALDVDKDVNGGTQW
jgi:hypothetical protein